MPVHRALLAQSTPATCKVSNDVTIIQNPPNEIVNVVPLIISIVLYHSRRILIVFRFKEETVSIL